MLRAAFRLTALAVLVAWSVPAGVVAQAPQISITNSCSVPVWIGQTPNTGFVPLPSAGTGPASRLNSSQTATYTIPSAGWGGRFWPKVGCDANGANCAAGSSVDGCPSTGCQPPADTKVEFFYNPSSGKDESWYDISLVDGYSLAMQITPSTTGGPTCTRTVCALSLASCPTAEISAAKVGDLRVFKDPVNKSGPVEQCLSPCKKWNYTAPYGLGKGEHVLPGEKLCCPTPPVSSPDCRAGIVVQTKYVQLVRAQCPTAYSFAYDDEGGLHTCPRRTSYTVTLCP
jgi:hypothetical protein